jgi:hypothetical protein
LGRPRNPQHGDQSGRAVPEEDRVVVQRKVRGEFLRAQIGRCRRQIVSEPRPENGKKNFESETALRGELFKVFFCSHLINLEL